VPFPNTQVLLMLHWHAFRHDFLFDATEARPATFHSVPASALQVNERWQQMGTIDLAAMEAAWDSAGVSRGWRHFTISPILAASGS
jgi:hypothetical protein